MDSRDLLVAPSSVLLTATGTTVLHRYSSGEVLIRTTSPTEEAPVEQGLRLSPDRVADLDEARGGFAAMDEDLPDVILAYLEMAGPIAGAWMLRLQELGVTPLRFQPVNTYLCRGSVAAFKGAAAESFVLRVTPLTAALKPAPRVSQPMDVWIVGHAPSEARTDFLATLRAAQGVEVAAALPVEDVDQLLHIPARLTPEGARAVRELQGVLAIEERRAPEPEDELANLIVAGQYDREGRPSGSYLRWLENQGLSGLGVAIGIVDAGVDTSHVAFSGRVTDLSDGARDWHGTFVAGHAAGAYLDERDSAGFIYGVGVAPRAEILVQSNQKGPADLCRETVRGAGPSGARGVVQNNSWGTGLSSDPGAMSYGALEASYDSLVRDADPGNGAPRPLVICFSTGNSGSKGLTRPKAAKNILVTGNSENWRPDVGSDDADNIRDVYAGTHASSWGNCGDGRIRPDVVAPGEWTASANYDSHPGEKEYISPRLTWGGGSSAASPKTAGACALLIQWWRRHGCEPSPALLRALIVNGAEPMGFRQPIPNRYEGWGRLHLANILDPQVSRVHEDQSVLLHERGEKKEWIVRVADPRRPVKVTLCWTDPPGAIGSGDGPTNSAIVNALVLRAFVGQRAYRGNNFENGWSVSPEVPGAQPEGGDNLQNIFLPAGSVEGVFRVVVEARNLAANCRDPRSVEPAQDFALVITNACLDEARVPAEVFLGVDAQESREAAHTGGDYWQPGSDDDRAELGGAALGTEAQARNATTARSDDDAWWDAGDSRGQGEATRQAPKTEVASPVSESARASATRGSLVAAAAAAVDLVTVGIEGRVVLGAGPQAEDGEGAPLVTLAGEASSEAVRGAVAKNVVTPLARALERLTTSWRLTEPRRRSAVFVVGRGTRVTSVDLARLRRISLLGQLYLVSDDAGVLDFLAQRLDRRRGVSFRLASDEAGVPALVRDTLAEAGGGRRLFVEQSKGGVAGGWVSVTHRFQVIPADRRLSVSISHPPAAAPRVRIRRPDGDVLNPFAPEDGDRPAGGALDRAAGLDALGVTARRSDLVTTIAIRATGARAWAGTWEVETAEPVPPAANADPSAEARVWSWGDLQLRVELREAEPVPGERRTEGGRSAPIGGRLVLEGSSGESFRSVEVETKKSGPSAELTRPVVVAPRPSRLDKEDVGASPGIAAEADRVPLLTSAMTVVPPTARGAKDGAKVRDFLLTVTGIDAAQNAFRRLVSVNALALEPRSAWRERLAPPPHFVAVTGARVAAVDYDAESGDIRSLILEKNGRRRTVRVASPGLQKALASVDLTARNLLFQVRDDELCAAVVVLGDVRPTLAEPGIEGPIPERAAPRAESTSTDYPDASRFVAAKFFQGSVVSRPIRTVVIHITDGAARIGGTISWFQNPQAANGTYSKVSAHYVVGQDGEVVQMVRDNDVAYHAGSANGDSIGIEHVARAPGAFGAGDPGLAPTETEYAASAALVRWLCEQYSVPLDRDHILGHAEADAGTTHAGCPNAVWDWAYFMGLVESGTSFDPSDGP